MAPLMRANMSHSLKYYTQYCSKFANDLIHQFIANILKCKLISQTGIEHHSLKTALLDMPTFATTTTTSNV